MDPSLIEFMESSKAVIDNTKKQPKLETKKEATPKVPKENTQEENKKEPNPTPIV